MTSCHHLKKGKVINKNDYAPYSYIQTTYIMSGKVMVPIMTTVYVPERFAISIRGQYNNKPRIEEVDLTLTDWQHTNVGDSITLK